MEHSGDTVAVWEVRLSDGSHSVSFEHNTTSGRRAITVDGTEVLRTNWRFRLVGSESFKIAGKPAEISVAARGMSFEYTLHIAGRSLKKFVEAQAKNTRVWLPVINGGEHRVVLEMDTMDVYVDGNREETFGEFTDDGTETHFTLAGNSAHIRAVSSGNKHRGLLYQLLLDGTQLDPVDELAIIEQ